MGGKGGSQTIGYRYFMSLLMGICRGPIDEVVQINVGGLRAFPYAEGAFSEDGSYSSLWWAIRDKLIADGYPAHASDTMHIAVGPDPNFGVATMVNGDAVNMPADTISSMRWNTVSQIDAAMLFGGDKKEGGIEGPALLLRGTNAQDPTADMLAKGFAGPIPAMRGVVTILYDGLVCSMNPYPKPWSFRVRRTENGWDGGPVWRPGLATIWMKKNSIKAMNPAHIIYECLTNRLWGRGYGRHLINDASFTAAAQTLYNEGMGLCLKWTRDTPLDEFIKTVINHIGGSLYVDREFGTIGLNLLRDDYVVGDIPLFTPDNGLLSIEESDTATSEELINEVVVEWFDPVTQQKRETRLHNLASIQSMGGSVKTMKVAYPGCPTQGLASKLAQRDLRANTMSLKKYNLILDRSAWRLIPGAPIRVSSPDDGIGEVVLRCGRIRQAHSNDGKIHVEAVMDVFGMPDASFVDDQETQFDFPNREVKVPSRRDIREITYADLSATLDPANLRELDNSSGMVGTVAAKPTNLSLGYVVAGKASTDTDYVTRETARFMPCVRLTETVGPMRTNIPFDQGIDVGLIRKNWAVVIGGEICRLDDIVSADSWSGVMTLSRGCIDTVPRQLNDDTLAYFFPIGERGTDGQEYTLGEQVDIKMLTFTPSARLELEAAPVSSITINARQARPYAPGDVKVDGNSIFQLPATINGDLNITWVHRNRKLIKDRLVGHTEGGMQREAGTTYTLQVRNPGGTLVRTESIEGGEFIYTTAMATEDGITTEAQFRLFAVRDGLNSQQSYNFTVNRP